MFEINKRLVLWICFEISFSVDDMATNLQILKSTAYQAKLKIRKDNIYHRLILHPKFLLYCHDLGMRDYWTGFGLNDWVY
jgi:hypothetical protein